MSLWTWIVVASLLAFATKLVGYLLPRRWLLQPRVARVANALTIGLLTSLTVVNAAAKGTALVLDARLGALAAAVVALALRAPFIVVVLTGALVAAGLRLLGVP